MVFPKIAKNRLSVSASLALIIHLVVFGGISLLVPSLQKSFNAPDELVLYDTDIPAMESEAVSADDTAQPVSAELPADAIIEKPALPEKPSAIQPKPTEKQPKSAKQSAAKTAGKADKPASEPVEEKLAKPAYPPRLLKQVLPAIYNGQGVILLKLLVGIDGHVEKVIVTKSSGDKSIDDIISSAIVKNWLFSPAHNAAHAPVRCYTSVPIMLR